MADILPFRKKKVATRPRGLCQHGFHKWEICKKKQFDVKSGKLVTVYNCSRCGASKVRTT